MFAGHVFAEKPSRVESQFWFKSHTREKIALSVSRYIAQTVFEAGIEDYPLDSVVTVFNGRYDDQNQPVYEAFSFKRSPGLVEECLYMQGYDVLRNWQPLVGIKKFQVSSLNDAIRLPMDQTGRLPVEGLKLKEVRLYFNDSISEEQQFELALMLNQVLFAMHGGKTGIPYQVTGQECFELIEADQVSRVYRVVPSTVEVMNRQNLPKPGLKQAIRDIFNRSLPG